MSAVQIKFSISTSLYKKRSVPNMQENATLVLDPDERLHK